MPAKGQVCVDELPARLSSRASPICFALLPSISQDRECKDTYFDYEIGVPNIRYTFNVVLTQLLQSGLEYFS